MVKKLLIEDGQATEDSQIIENCIFLERTSSWIFEKGVNPWKIGINL